LIRERVKEYKKELILKKISRFLEKEGFENAKMADIAAYCGISVGALYKLFSSKEELFYSYIQYQIDLFYKKLEEGFQRIKEPRERVCFFIKLKFETFKEKKKVLIDTVAADPLFFAKLNTTKQNPAKKVYELLAKELEKAGIAKPLKMAYLLNGLTLGYLELWLSTKDEGALDADEACGLFIKLIKE